MSRFLLLEPFKWFPLNMRQFMESRIQQLFQTVFFHIHATVFEFHCYSFFTFLKPPL